MTEQTMCICGQPLHYATRESQRIVQMMIDEFGDDVMIRVLNSDVWYFVPRHYIALHGVRAADLPALAAHYGWKRA